MTDAISNELAASPRARRTPGDARAWAPFALGIAAIVLVLFRWRAFGLPLETDECNYAYIGNRLLLGDRLYVDVWDHQPFGVFVLFAGAIAPFGDAPVVFRLLSTAFSLVSLVLVFGIARRVGGPIAAVGAALLFAVASSDPGVAGEGCNREIYMNTFVLAAWYAALQGSGSDRSALIAGLLLGIGSTIKTILAVHWLVLLPWFLSGAVRTSAGKFKLSTAARVTALFGLGPAVIWLLSGAYFAGTGRFGAFFEAVFTFNLSYSDGGGPFWARFVHFVSPPRHPFVFESALPLWIAGALGTLWSIGVGVTSKDVQRRRGNGAIALLAFAGLLAVCLPGRFWPHYYYLLLPTAVLTTAGMMTEIGSAIVRRHGNLTTFARAAAPALLAIIVAWTSWSQYRHYLGLPLEQITVKRYNSRDFWGRAQGHNVRRVTQPGDTVFVFGNDTGIYYYSQRRCASRYTMITGLQSRHAGATKRQQFLLSELRAAPPRVIVVLFDEKPFDGWLAFLDRYYGRAVGVDHHDRTGSPIMFVFARRDQPIEAIDWDWTFGKR